MSRWEFWIDVGGTFTDCLARRPDGTRVCHKTLSSGVIKGQAGVGSTSTQLVDPLRAVDPPGFWCGWTIHLFDDHGQVTASRTLVRSSTAAPELAWDSPLPTAPHVGQSYELVSGLDAPLVAIRYLLACPLDQPLPPITVRLGTTRGTNALLTRQGARVAWITTRGLGDLLRIGYQARPRLFELTIRKPLPLFSTSREVRERLAADGTILEPLDLNHAREQLVGLQAAGIESLAIGLMHAYLNPVHELQLEQLARDVGFRAISLSHRVAPLIKLVPRGDTTVVDAYLNPLLQDYVTRLGQDIGSQRATDLRLMTSAGGLVQAKDFHGKDSILSGPAGGAVGCARIALAAGHSRAIGFDMGGTSTDVMRYDGRFEYEYETEKAGVRLVTPMLAIETVAAGGGSICSFDGVKLTVGPASAGAEPGPACYGRGGPLTVTDINLVLGRLPADSLPFPLSQAAASQRLDELLAQVNATRTQPLTPIQLAEGLLRIANTNMAQAIRSVSVARGYDPRDYLLVAFGGAAMQHACHVARQLGMRQILDHRDASVLSALGIGLADVAHQRQRGVYQPWDQARGQLPRWFAELAAEAAAAVAAEGIPAARVEIRRSVELRYEGTDWPLTVMEPVDQDYAAEFQRNHQRLYGYTQAHRPLVLVTVRVDAMGDCGWSLPPSCPIAPRRPSAAATKLMIVAGQTVEVACYRRADLAPGDTVSGPCLIVHETSTTVVDAGWSAGVWEQGEIMLTDDGSDIRDEAGVERDPILLEVFHGHFAAIARQMGITLRNTSVSVNVKERLDFSCAVFTSDGNLVVNAPHIPVHLGAMSETVKCVLADHPDLAAGDVIVTNDPFRGGSHLPDVTVVTPVFDAEDQQLRFVVASRAHHAEIGGITPGSLPPFSRTLADEGILLRSFHVLRRGQPQLDELRARLSQGPNPSRDVDANVADNLAQIAANQQGVRDLQQLQHRYGWPVVSAYMQHIQAAAETKIRQALLALPDGRYEFADQLDDGAELRVAIDIRGDQALFDFSGSAPVQTTNLNANLAIVTAAVMYCLRCLIDEPIPLNQGVLAPIELRVPAGMLNPSAGPTPEDCPAVAGGNVETSQRVVDIILGAFNAAAASQGTMNNLLFGNERFGYYETICGGAGATASGPGADAVQTHMTNTRLTDPEVLERKFPVRLLEFSIRTDSAGRGAHPGGQGVVRTFQFLEPLDVSILSQRRGRCRPFGLAGGEPAAAGENELWRSDGSREPCAGRVQLRVQPGDRLVIKTPGGGGYGPAPPPSTPAVTSQGNVEDRAGR